MQEKVIKLGTLAYKKNDSAPDFDMYEIIHAMENVAREIIYFSASKKSKDKGSSSEAD